MPSSRIAASASRWPGVVVILSINPYMVVSPYTNQEKPRSGHRESEDRRAPKRREDRRVFTRSASVVTDRFHQRSGDQRGHDEAESWKRSGPQNGLSEHGVARAPTQRADDRGADDREGWARFARAL